MKKILVAFGAAALFSAPVLAADLPIKAPVYKAASVTSFNWTGCYVGANAGHAWAQTSLAETSVNGNPISFNRGAQTDRGWAYGGQLGCDYQFDRRWVIGVRGLWDGADITGSHVVGPGDFIAGTDHVKIDSFATLVGKLGFLLHPAVQLYGLAGVAWVHDRYVGTAPGSGEIHSGKQSRIGYDVGVGLSWMFARHWDLWVEYDYMGLGTKNVIFTGEGVNCCFKIGIDSKQNVSKVLVGIDYRFDITGTPIGMKN